MDIVKAVLEKVAEDAALAAYFAGGIAVDDFPADAELPYLVGRRPIPQTAILVGDRKTFGTFTEVQLDVWEDRGSERSTVVDEIRAQLDGAKLSEVRAPGWSRCRFVEESRDPEGDDDGPADVIHKVILIAVARAI